ncbi:hypothetical protein [uncultured Roseobacter sp.]|uniref:hypothetical protein n=1 Tax=uncultured Roseobacter sp. TaxID=114847 RepID=UPI0026189D75|nr:hypothetical protein [uncultured Roseobacter sp.]
MSLTNLLLIAVACGLLLPLQSKAAVYSCQSETFCKCKKAQGCSAGYQYLDDRLTHTCRDEQQVFEATTLRRAVRLDGEKLKIKFREARPYFSDLDWYQAGATGDRGLINLRFDNEGRWSDFQITQMVQGSINDHIWTLTGKCERKE